MLLGEVHRGFKPQGYKEGKDPLPAFTELTIQQGRWICKQEVLGMQDGSFIPADPSPRPPQAIMHFLKDNFVFKT